MRILALKKAKSSSGGGTTPVELQAKSGGLGSIQSTNASYSAIDGGTASYIGTNKSTPVSSTNSITYGAYTFGTFTVARGFAKFNVASISGATSAKFVIDTGTGSTEIASKFVAAAQSDDLTISPNVSFVSVNKTKPYVDGIFGTSGSSDEDIPVNAACLADINNLSELSVAALTTEDLAGTITNSGSLNAPITALKLIVSFD